MAGEGDIRQGVYGNTTMQVFNGGRECRQHAQRPKTEYIYSVGVDDTHGHLGKYPEDPFRLEVP